MLFQQRCRYKSDTVRHADVSVRPHKGTDSDLITLLCQLQHQKRELLVSILLCFLRMFVAALRKGQCLPYIFALIGFQYAIHLGDKLDVQVAREKCSGLPCLAISYFIGLGSMNHTLCVEN